jgi:hypothetical protein
MDWIKVLNRHVLLEYNDLRDSEFVAWIKIMALAAYLEHEPTHEQMLKYVHHATLKSLDDKLMKHSCTLHDVLMKVLCDAHEVSMRREAWKQKKKQQREDKKNVPRDVPRDVPDREKEKRREREEKDNIIPPVVADKSATCPHEEIIALYHKILPELPVVKIWTPKRQGYLRSRWKEAPERQNIEWWEKYFTKIKQSPFLTGNVNDFKASLEWVVNQSNMVKILEGKYDGGNGNVGIRTSRSDPRDPSLQNREDAEVQIALALWETAKKSTSSNPPRDAPNDDAPNFSGE